jgi:VanZ family protein
VLVRANEARALNARSLRSAWLVIGWLGVLGVIYLSLMPHPPEIRVVDGDKIAHVGVYASLMAWFAQPLLHARARSWTAIGLIALGIALEFAQSATAYRSFEYADMTADTLGVVLGWVLAPPRLPNVLAIATRRLAPS